MEDLLQRLFGFVIALAVVLGYILAGNQRVLTDNTADQSVYAQTQDP